MNVKQPITVSEVSAGGLVVSADNPNKVALISHRNRGGGRNWVIPKGHVEAGEDLEQTALREVAEETGIAGEVVSKLGEVNYRFTVGKTRVNKTVHHFLLRQTGGNLTSEGDPTGEVLEVQWFSLTEVSEVLAHANEKGIAEVARKLLS